jgi:hypothetical protein
MTKEQQNFIENFILYFTDYNEFWDAVDELEYGKYFYNKTIGELRALKTDENFYKVCKDTHEKMNSYEKDLVG